MRFPLLAASLLLCATLAHAEFVNFETPHVHPIDLSPDGTTLAVCNTADNRVELFDLTATGKPEPLGSVFVGMDPVTARFETNTTLWVVNQISDTVSVIDVPNRVVKATLQTKDEPADVVFDQNLALVSCSQANAVQTFDRSNLAAAPGDIAVLGEEPRAMAVDPGGLVHVAFFESGNETTILAGGGDGDVINFPPNAVSDPRGPYGGTNPPPNNGNSFSPPERPGNPNPPGVGLIVRKDATETWRDDTGADWTALVSGNLASASVASKAGTWSTTTSR